MKHRHYYPTWFCRVKTTKWIITYWLLSVIFWLFYKCFFLSITSLICQVWSSVHESVSLQRQIKKQTFVDLFSHLLWAPLTFPPSDSRRDRKRNNKCFRWRTRDGATLQKWKIKMKSTKTYLPDSNASSSDGKENKQEEITHKAGETDEESNKRQVNCYLLQHISHRWPSYLPLWVKKGNKKLNLRESAWISLHSGFAVNMKFLLTFLYSAHFSKRGVKKQWKPRCQFWNCSDFYYIKSESM